MDNDPFEPGARRAVVEPVTRRFDGLLNFAEDARYWWRDNGPLALLILAMIVFVPVMLIAFDREAKEKAAHEARFMAECQQDKKHYECEALWRQGEDHEHMIPVVIPMATGR